MQQLILILLILLFGFVSCSKDNSLAPLVQQVEALMPHRPDSALILLERIKNVEKFSKRNKARYYLLLTEAQDKNYVNHTTDSLITISTEYYEDANDLKCKAKAWYYKGIINQELEHPLEAQTCFLKALRDEERINDYTLLGRINNNLGMLYTNQQVYEQATTYQKKAIRCFQSIKDSTGQIFALRNLGRNYTMINQHDSAIACYQLALSLMGNKKVISLYTELGSLFAEKQLYPQASRYIHEALAQSNPAKINYPLYLTAGHFYQQTGQIDSALFYLRPCMENDDTRTSAALQLAMLADKQGDFKVSVEFYKKYQILRDSVSECKKTESIHEIQEVYNFHEGEKKLSDAYLAIDHLEIAHLWMALGICAMFILLSIFYILHKAKIQKVERQRLKIQELREDSEKLKSLLAENEHNIELLSKEIKALEEQKQANELMSLRREQIEQENRSMMERLKRRKELDEKFQMSGICFRFRDKEEWKPTENDWSELFQSIDNAYDNFTSQLNSLARLSDKELKVCCLVKTNVSVHIISTLLNCTQTNISMIRNRLYEKIHKEKGSAEQFDEFIRSF